MSSERTYYADATGVRVGTSQLVFPSATYATRNVTSVEAIAARAPALGAYVVMTIGAALFFYGAFAGSEWGFVGVAGILSGQIRLLRRRRNRGYGVRITTSKGPVTVFAARNRRQVEQVTAAVRRAIAGQSSDAVAGAPPRRARQPRPRRRRR